MNASLQPFVHNEILVGIGDVARFLNVPAHTLRFWEKEFGFYLAPCRTQGRQRRYDDTDIQRLGRIKDLLKIEGYSIAGAKRILQKGSLEDSVNTYIARDLQLA